MCAVSDRWIKMYPCHLCVSGFCAPVSLFAFTVSVSGCGGAGLKLEGAWGAVG